MKIHESPIDVLIVAGLVLLSVCSAARGVRRLVRGLDGARPLEIIRGIRDIVVAFVASVLIVWVVSGHMAFLILAAIVLAEELYETGVLSAIIRRGEGFDGQVGDPPTS